MKDAEWIKGIATESFKGSGYFRCSKCKRIFELGDNVNTKTYEIDYNLCDDCFN